nr:hypothetical protein [Nocardiopsis ansamitocini]
MSSRIALRVRALPDVVELSSGSFGTLATPLPGGTVDGVAVRDDIVEVGVVVRYGRPLPEVAADVQAAVVPLAEGRAVHVSVEDVIAGLPETREER